MTNTKPFTYKQLVAQIAAAKTLDDAGTVGGQINMSFEAEKITWADFETLWALLNRIYELEEHKRKAAEQ